MSRRQAVPARVVAITGAARGIGRATAATLAERGAEVFLGDRDLDIAADAAAAIGPNAHALHVDVCDETSFDAFLDAVEDRAGALDVLVNNAGIMPIGPFADEALATTLRIVDVNVLGTLIGSRAAIARMVPRGTGHVINVASVTGRSGLAGAVTYSASKHAVVGLSAALADELLASGVKVSCVLPGPVDTELATGLSRPRVVGISRPDDVAHAIARTIERPRAMVYVPRVARVAVNVAGHLSPPVRGALLRALGGARSALDADSSARADYEQRVNGDTRSRLHDRTPVGSELVRDVQD
jgi:NADP-dependent 3-hydroxy acid dehydrogenase YdfG